MSWHLLKVFGRRVFVGYGIIALLSVSILAALHFTSRYGLQAYVSEQLDRIPWDIAIVQGGETHRFLELQQQYARIAEIREVEAIGFLRVRLIAPLQLDINGDPVPVRWLGFISASRPELLPPELRKYPLVEKGIVPGGSSIPNIAVALAGIQDDAIQSLLTEKIQQGRRLRLSIAAEHGHDDEEHALLIEHDHSRPVLFEGQVFGTISQIERKEFNKWMLREIGSLFYLPEEAIIVPVSLKVFEELAGQFHRLLLVAEHGHGGAGEPPPYVPEVTHLISIDRGRVVSTWDLQGSISRLAPIVGDAYLAARWLTPFAYVNSSLLLLLERMNGIARLVSLATLLIGIPLLWMGWIMGSTLSRLLVLNERRLIGLALIRGVPMRDIGRALLLALLLGGLLGGLLGLVLGTGVPFLSYYLAGHPTPPPGILLRGMAYFALFLGVGLILAVLSGRGILSYVRRLTPREAIARVAADESAFQLRFSWHYITISLIALVIAGYKIISWIFGYSVLLATFRGLLPEAVLNWISVIEGLLNFVAIPLFLYGLAGLLMWRAGWVQKALSALTAPLVGSLRWFVSQYMTLGRHRVANLLFVAAMAMSLSLLPQVSADTFYDRVFRGIRASLGAHLLLEFDMLDLTGGETGVEAVSRYQQILRPRLDSIRRAIEREQIAAVEVIEQFFVPGIYIPGQSGLALEVLEDPGNYLQIVYNEDSLGINRSFSQIIASLADGNISASQGLFRVRAIRLGGEAMLGYSSDRMPVNVRLTDMIAFLPGQPALGIQQREGYVAAEIDYLNYLFRSDARIIAANKNIESSALGSLQVLPSRVVFLVKARDGAALDALAKDITRDLPFQPEEVRFEASEKRRVSKDMFISLALENMKVYMAGGLILALTSIAAIALANFLADRRTFALLRLRGLSLPLLLRISLSIFMIPVIGGVTLGILLGAISGYGMSQIVWDLPRVYGAAGSLSNRLVFSNISWTIALAVNSIFTVMALGFGFWLFRRTAREAIVEG